MGEAKAVEDLARSAWVFFHHCLGVGEGGAHRRIAPARRHRQQQQTKAWESYPFHFSMYSFGVLSFVGKDTALFQKNKGFRENFVFRSQITLLPAKRFLFVVGAAYIYSGSNNKRKSPQRSTVLLAARRHRVGSQVPSHWQRGAAALGTTWTGSKKVSLFISFPRLDGRHRVWLPIA